jgi:hypothetical protein
LNSVKSRGRFSRFRFKIIFLIAAFFLVFGLDYFVLSFARVSRPALPTSGIAFRLLENVKVLTQPDWRGRRPKTEGNRQAALWIEDQLKKCGIRSFPSLYGYRQALKNELGVNVIGFKSAEVKSDDWIIVGAHFDHVGESGFFNRVHWGADDNASSVSILLETACSVPFLKKTNLAFVAYNTEEPPYFISVDMGSQVFADNLPPEIKNIVLTVSMDLMGGAHWRPMLNSIFVVGGGTGEGLTEVISKTRIEGLKISQFGYHAVERLPIGLRSPVSDYVPFLKRGIPSLLLSTGRTPRYHSPSDTYDTLDYFGMEKRQKWLNEFLIGADGFNGKFTTGDSVDLQLEVQGLREYADLATSWMTRIPGSSLISLYHFKRDSHRLQESLDDSEKRVLIERIVGRFQCQMMNLPVCFLID